MARVICAIGILLCLSACAKPEYWINGLTLPPGSTVVSQTESKTAPGVPGMTVPMMGEVEKTMMVSFNDPAGWDSVAAHIDKCMKAQGYTEGFGSLQDMMSGTAGGNAPGAKMMDYMRMYSKAGSQYSVMLYSMQAMADEYGGGGGMDMSSLGMGQYDMQIMKYK